jgi:hypothetical protein
MDNAISLLLHELGFSRRSSTRATRKIGPRAIAPATDASQKQEDGTKSVTKPTSASVDPSAKGIWWL